MPPTGQCENYVVVTLSNWHKIAHATAERLLQQIYESVCNNSDGATYWLQEVTLVLQLSLDLHKMFTFSCAIDSVDRDEQLACKVQRRLTDAGSEVFVLAAVWKCVQCGDVRLVIDRSLPDRSLPDRNKLQRACARAR